MNAAINSIEPCCKLHVTLFDRLTDYKLLITLLAYLLFSSNLNAQYCNSFGNALDGYLTLNRLVEFNTINNPTNNDDNDYSDFTSISTDIERGSTYDLTLNVNTDGGYTVHSFAWIDWNQDDDFDDANEAYDLGTAFNTNNGPLSLVPFPITVPDDAVLGPTRMRISTRWNQNPTSCGQNFDGEVEDYTVNILEDPTPPVINPDLEVGACDDFKVILVLDESGSIDPGSNGGTSDFGPDVINAAKSMVDGLLNSGTQLAVIEFASLASISNINGTAGFQEVTPAYKAAFDTYIDANYDPRNNAVTQGVWTNWQDAFQKVLDLDTADLVLFVTDGNPTAIVKPGASCPTACDDTYLTTGCTDCDEATSLAPAVVNADLVKAEGTHVFVLGIGTSIDESNIIDISGTDKDLCPENDLVCQAANPTDPPFNEADYALIPFSELAACLTQLATLSCNTDIKLEKTVALGQDNCAGASELVTAPIGSDITYCFTVENTGDGSLEFVEFVDSDLGLNLTTIGAFNSTMTTISGSWPLDPGEIISFYINTTISGNLINTASVTGQVTGEDSVTDEDTAEVQVPACTQTATCNLQDINTEDCDIPDAFTDPADVFSGIEACGAVVTMDHTDVGDTDVCGDGTGASFVRTYTLYFDGQAFETCEQNITITDTTAPTFDNQNCGSSDASAAAYDDGWQTGDNDGSGFEAWNLTPVNSGNKGFFVASSTINGDGDSNGDGDIDTAGRSLGMFSNNGGGAIATRNLSQAMAVGSTVTFEMDNGFINSGPGAFNRALFILTANNLISWRIEFNAGDLNYTVFDQNSIPYDSGIPFTDEGLRIHLEMDGLNTIHPIIISLGTGVIYDLGSVVRQNAFYAPDGIYLQSDSPGEGSASDLFINNMEICHSEVPNEITLNCDDPIPTATAPPVSDNCDSNPNVSFDTTTAQGDCNTNTIITRTWTATDACGNSSQFVQTINILPDSEAPVLTDPAPLADISCSDALPAQETLTATDDCSSVTVTPSVDPFTPDVCNGYAITYRWTATDACNNSSEKTVTFNVLPDAQAPVLTDPAPLADISCNDAFPAQETLTATDDCSSVTVTPSVDPFTPDVCNGYAITYRWTATDACNNSSEKTVTFNVLPDSQAPVLTDPAPLSDISCSDALPAQETLTATDDCSSVTVTPSVDPFTPDVCNGYAITYRWTATDACNNSSEKTVTFNVLPDAQAPVLTDPEPLADISCSDALPAQVTLTATDDCSAVTVIPSVDPFTPDVCNGYAITYRWTATDACNNSSEKTVTFNVLPDAQAPVLNDPAPLADISCSDALPAQQTLTATDDCSAVTITPSVDPFTPDVCNGYAITYRWTATDACNNSSEKTVTFNVLPDTQAPVLNDPALLADISCSDALPAQETLTATDDCSAVTVTPSVDPFTPDVCNGYAVTYRWTATDACNNSSEKTVTFNVLPDSQAPVLTDPAPLADISCSDALPAQETLTATDDCSTVTVTPSVDPFTPDVCNGYAITYRWTATDACNNSSEKTVTFNVLPDAQAPVLTDPAPLADISCSDPLPAQETLTATDDCSAVTVTPSIDAYTEDVCNGYAITYRWTATDACNNSSEKTVTFNVLPDLTAPVITCPA
ncbi:GEVED domain-containing protein, partial [Psychroserpens sp.]